jgi:hypothetical protein
MKTSSKNEDGNKNVRIHNGIVMKNGISFNPNSAIGFGRISQRLRAVAQWTLPRRTLWCVERKGQCANAEGFAKGVPNAIAESGFNIIFSLCFW